MRSRRRTRPKLVCVAGARHQPPLGPDEHLAVDVLGEVDAEERQRSSYLVHQRAHEVAALGSADAGRRRGRGRSGGRNRRARPRPRGGRPRRRRRRPRCESLGDAVRVRDPHRAARRLESADIAAGRIVPPASAVPARPARPRRSRRPVPGEWQRRDAGGGGLHLEQPCRVRGGAGRGRRWPGRGARARPSRKLGLVEGDDQLPAALEGDAARFAVLVERPPPPARIAPP